MRLEGLIDQVEQLRADMITAETANARQLARVHPQNRASARNLIHYVALRRHDLRELQEELSQVGLSSLGRMEAGVLGHLDLVRRALKALAGQPAADTHEPVELSPAAGGELLARNANRLLGQTSAACQTRIMVTMPSEATADPTLVQGMVEAGTNIARINCAHDTADD